MRPQALALFCEKTPGEVAVQTALAPDFEKALHEDVDAPVAFRVTDGTPFSLRRLLERVKTDDVPVDGKVYERNLKADAKPGEYFVETVDGRRSLAKVHLVATIQRTKLPPENAKYHEYTTPDGNRAELSRSFTRVPGQEDLHELNVVLIPSDTARPD